MSTQRKIVLDKFCLRQFNKSLNTSILINYDPKEVERIVNEKYISSLALMVKNNLHPQDYEKNHLLKPGYAPFCKHIFIENFISDLKTSTIEINKVTEPLIKSGYEARTEKELPVLRRYINRSEFNEEDIPTAKYLDIILYSKEQIGLETQAQGEEDEHKNVDYDFGIISIKPQGVDYELPMDPITVLRNALGKEEGGSGVPLDRTKYMESVRFWEKNVILK